MATGSPNPRRMPVHRHLVATNAEGLEERVLVSSSLATCWSSPVGGPTTWEHMLESQFAVIVFLRS